MSSLRTAAVLAFIVGVSCSQSSDCSYKALWSHLRLTTSQDFIANVRPVKNWTTPTLVEIELLLYGILDVDEKSQTVIGHIWIQLYWRNEFLTWDPNLFCGIKSITVPRWSLWIPDLMIQEDASDSGSVQMSPYVKLCANGFSHATFRQRLTFTCQLNLSLFPFDSQTCNITFSSMVHDKQSVFLKMAKNETRVTQFSDKVMITRGEWQLKRIELFTSDFTRTNSTESIALFSVTIVRRPMLYVVIFIVPLAYLLVLDLVSFFIDESRGEKLGFKVTVLLSISVLLLILKDMLPSTEDNLPLIANYCVGIFALVGLSLLEAMLVSFLISFDNEVDKDTQSPRDVGVNIQLEVKHHEVTDDANSENCSPPLNCHGDHTLLRRIQEELKALQRKAEGQSKGRRKPGCFRRISHIIDWLFFIFYLITVIIFMVYMCTLWTEAYFHNVQN